MNPCSDCGSVNGRHPGTCTRRPIARRLHLADEPERVAWRITIGSEHIGDVFRVELDGHVHYRCVDAAGEPVPGRGRVWEWQHAVNALASRWTAQQAPPPVHLPRQTGGGPASCQGCGGPLSDARRALGYCTRCVTDIKGDA